MVSLPFNPDRNFIAPWLYSAVPSITSGAYRFSFRGEKTAAEDSAATDRLVAGLKPYPVRSLWWTQVGVEPTTSCLPDKHSTTELLAHMVVFSFCPPCKLVNARCSRLVTAQGWKLPSKSIPTAFHVFLDGLEPPSQCLNMHQRSYSTLPLSYRNIYIVDTCGIRTPLIPCKGIVPPLHYMAHSAPFVTGRSNTDPS